MARIDYGQVPTINPDFVNARIVSRRGGANACDNCKYIDNQYLNSANKNYNGFSLVGKSKNTGKWRILKVWGLW